MNLPFLKTGLGDTPVVVEEIFNTSSARAFQAWCDPKQIIKWFRLGDRRIVRADIDLRPGGNWCFEYDEFAGEIEKLHGKYVKIELDRLLVFTWTHEHRFADRRTEATPVSQITVNFKPVDNGVLIRLTHAGIERERGRDGVGRGWSGLFGNLSGLLRQTTDSVT